MATLNWKTATQDDATAFTSTDILFFPEGSAQSLVITVTPAVGATPATTALSLAGKTLNFDLNTIAGDGSVIFADGTVFVYGAAGNEAVNGGALADYILGNDGADTLNGAGGNDTIEGGAGMENMTGGNGADVFVFKTGDSSLDFPAVGVLDGIDSISDWQGGVDKIDLAVDILGYGEETIADAGADLLDFQAALAAANAYFTGAGTGATVYVVDVLNGFMWLFVDDDSTDGANFAIEIGGAVDVSSIDVSDLM